MLILVVVIKKYIHVNRLIEFQPMYGQKEESMIWGIWGCVTPDVEL